MFDGLDDKMRADPAFASVAAQLALQEQAADAGEIPVLMEQVAANQNDHQARFDLAMALHAAGKRQAAADELLEVVRRDRKWSDDGARKQRSEEHTSELQSLMRISYAVFCLQKKKEQNK